MTKGITRGMYSVRDGFRIKGNPQAIGERLDIIVDQEGNLHPKAIIEDARSPKSPLHNCFEWDDTKAAHAHRLDQARYLIRSLTVVYVEHETEIHTVPYVSINSSDSPYTATRTVMSNAEKRQQFVAQALKELRAWRYRYQHYQELSKVYEAIKPFIS